MNVIHRDDWKSEERGAAALESNETTEAPETFDANATYSEVVFSNAWQEHRPEAYHQYRRDWQQVPASRTELDFPLNLDIETTTRCNLLCPMCPRTLLVEKGEFNDFGFLTHTI